MKKIFNPTTIDELLASKPEVRDMTISEVMDLTDGPKKKFYLIKYIRLAYPKGLGGSALRRFSCAELIDGMDSQTLDNSIILKPIN